MSQNLVPATGLRGTTLTLQAQIAKLAIMNTKTHTISTRITTGIIITGDGVRVG